MEHFLQKNSVVCGRLFAYHIFTGLLCFPRFMVMSWYELLFCALGQAKQNPICNSNMFCLV
jgi:hypothetical protein